MAPTVLVHSSPADLLAALARAGPGADTVRTNLAIGPVFEIWLEQTTTSLAASKPVGKDQTTAPTAKNEKKPDEGTQLLVTVWEGDELQLIFTKLSFTISRLVSPLPPSRLPSLTPLFAPLIAHLLTLHPFSLPEGPSLLRTIAGPELLLVPFLSLWPHPHDPTPTMRMHADSAVTAPGSSAVDLPAGHSIALVDISTASEAAVTALAHLTKGFFDDISSAPKLSVEQAKAFVRRTVPEGALWAYSMPPIGEPQGEAVPVAFINTGRPTLRTVAIRGVFVDPSHRRRGIAERSVAQVVRQHLSVRPLPYSLSAPPPPFDPATKWGGKAEVCLSVEVHNMGARGVYKRVGFAESDDTWVNYNLEGVEPGRW
ncbi:hypothetical protein JCM1841_006346 [Sporobolomyces salmonicolor]